MRKQKLLAIVLCAALVSGILSGCGNQEPEPANDQAVVEETEESAEEEAPEDASSEDAAPEEEAGTEEAQMPEGFDKTNVDWIVPAAAGSAIDLVSRALVDALGKDLGANIVIENIAGASQTIGASEFAIREADGHNLLTIANACYFTQPLANELTYDIADWRPICNLAPPSSCVVVVKSGSELGDKEKWFEKLQSGEFTYGFANSISMAHLAALQMLESLEAESGTPVVYDGSPELTAAVLSGEIDFAVMEDSVAVSYVENGEMVPVIACTNEVHYLFPDTAYLGEYIENFVPINGIKCLAVRKDTPEEEVDWLKDRMNAALASENYQSYLESNGYSRMEIMDEEELAAWLEDMLAIHEEVMRGAGLID